MIYKGMEEATQGMVAMRAMQDTISNNLANANTVGFQQDALSISDFGEEMRTAMGGEVPAGYDPTGGGITGDVHLLMQKTTEFAPGQLKHTGQIFDLALGGNGFFTIRSPHGIRFTRAGNFSVNGRGYLVAKDGGTVLGEHGAILVKGSDFKVKADGSVEVDGKGVDKLRISWADPKRLVKAGDSSYASADPTGWPEADNPQVMQGYLELSNVNAVKEMVSMITVNRAFEADAKMLEIEDGMAKRANQLAASKG